MYVIYKKLGETPLEALERLRIEKNLQESKLAYAGRLDPMAHGLMLILEGKECKQRDIYQNLDKTYLFEILFGVETDTFDVLGYVQNVNTLKIDLAKVHEEIKKLNKQKLSQKYPPFSSKTVQGKPLFWWTRNGLLDQINIPKKKVEIKHISVLDTFKLNSQEILQTALDKISKVKGDFRQDKITERWNFLLSATEHNFVLMKLQARVSSGTYIRSICHDIGKKLGTGAIAWDIERTQIGKYKINSDQICI
jgi:tRNA pseudouridine55 synthase